MAKEKDVVKSSFGTSVIKHSAAVSISNEVTLVQRKSWNLLLANAYNDLPNESVKQFSIPLTVLAEKLEYSVKNITYLKDNIRALANVKVEYDILGKSGEHEEWGIEHILVSPKIINGLLYYEFPWSLRKKLYNPLVYAKINLLLQNVFSSKYALALYELCVDYYRVRDQRGETGYIPVSTWRKLLGIADEEYKRFKDFNAYVIKNSIEEINERSDLHAEPVYKRKGRNVEFIKILIKKNPKTKLEIIPTRTTIDHKQLDLFQFLEAENKNLLNKMLAYGVEKDLALTALREKPETEIADILDYVDEKIENGKVTENVGGYLAALLRGDFKKPTRTVATKKKMPPVKEGDLVEYEGNQYRVDENLFLRDGQGRPILTIGQLLDALKNKSARVVG